MKNVSSTDIFKIDDKCGFVYCSLLIFVGFAFILITIILKFVMIKRKNRKKKKF